MLAPILVLLAFGAAALPNAGSIACAVDASFVWVGVLARFRPRLLLRIHLWLRAVDCAIVYLVHGRRRAWTLSAVAGVAVLLSRIQLTVNGALPFAVRQFTDAMFLALFFLLTSTAVAFLMDKTAEVVVRRERALSAEISSRKIIPCPGSPVPVPLLRLFC